MQTSVSTDICIIGAGPAGATTSLFLSKFQIPHMIVDAAVFPRDKVCGDALDLKVMRVLNQLDPAIVENEIMHNDNFLKAQGCSIIISKDRRCDLDIKPKGEGEHYPFFFTARRGYFDNFLASKINPAYADFRQGTTVKSIVKEGDKWRITARAGNNDINITAKLLVGADGDHSVVLRSIGERKIERDHYAAALRQYWKGVTGITKGNHIEVYLPKSLPMAYLWIFPLPNGEANVGCGLMSHIIAKKKVKLRDVFNDLLANDPALAHRFKDATPLEKPVGWGLPLASQKRMPYGDGYLLTGDAASLVSPTTGEGVGPGMLSGYIAAHYIQRAVKQNNFGKAMFANYDREVQKRLKPDVLKYNILRKLSPILYNQLINVLASLGAGQYYFDKRSHNWLHTAKHKRIDVEF